MIKLPDVDQFKACPELGVVRIGFKYTQISFCITICLLSAAMVRPFYQLPLLQSASLPGVEYLIQSRA